MRPLPSFVGWFDSPDQEVPAHMPADDVACPVCGLVRGPKGRVRDDGKTVLVNIDILSNRDPRSLQRLAWLLNLAFVPSFQRMSWVYKKPSTPPLSHGRGAWRLQSQSDHRQLRGSV